MGDPYAVLRARVAPRYLPCGRFAFHYTASKLRHDPLTAALLECVPGGFGQVADLGCGRGQFSALLLEANLAQHVIGLERNARLLEQARFAMRGLAFEGHLADLAAAPPLPRADTVLLLDVLYQLASPAQNRLLADVAAAAGRHILIRTADPACGARAWLMRTTERLSRRFWPHAGDVVNIRPVSEITSVLEAAGFTISAAPCQQGTPFANVLIHASRRGSA